MNLLFKIAILGVVAAAEQIKCPVLSCANKNMNDTNMCYTHDGKDPTETINLNKCKEPTERCFLKKDQYAWVDSNYQFTPPKDRPELPDGRKHSQILDKFTKQQCTLREAENRNMYNGRKCIYPHQCYSRICDSETKQCTGRMKGESCSGHVECNNGLACRPSTIWPFETVCLPMADVGSHCESEYDCKPRNFCWKLDKSYNDMCLEKHSAPDRTKFFWDMERFPSMTKESVMFHGQYCQSGTAKLASKDTAECVSIDAITEQEDGKTEKDLAKPFECKPDGKTKCNYKKDGKTQFSLLCECGLRKIDERDIGYCPIPDLQMLQTNIHWLKLMWNGDNCHTYDRYEFIAQKDCGIQMNYGVLKNVTVSRFNVTYYPYIQGDNYECLSAFIPDSSENFFSSHATKLTVPLTMLLVGSFLFMN